VLIAELTSPSLAEGILYTDHTQVIEMALLLERVLAGGLLRRGSVRIAQARRQQHVCYDPLKHYNNKRIVKPYVLLFSFVLRWQFGPTGSWTHGCILPCTAH